MGRSFKCSCNIFAMSESGGGAEESIDRVLVSRGDLWGWGGASPGAWSWGHPPLVHHDAELLVAQLVILESSMSCCIQFTVSCRISGACYPLPEHTEKWIERASMQSRHCIILLQKLSEGKIAIMALRCPKIFMFMFAANKDHYFK